MTMAKFRRIEIITLIVLAVAWVAFSAFLKQLSWLTLAPIIILIIVMNFIERWLTNKRFQQIDQVLDRASRQMTDREIADALHVGILDLTAIRQHQFLPSMKHFTTLEKQLR